MSKPTWTTTPPSEPGLYWCQSPYLNTPDVAKIIMREPEQILRAYFHGEEEGEWVIRLAHLKWWPVPLTPPNVEQEGVK